MYYSFEYVQIFTPASPLSSKKETLALCQSNSALSVLRDPVIAENISSMKKILQTAGGNVYVADVIEDYLKNY